LYVFGQTQEILYANVAAANLAADANGSFATESGTLFKTTDLLSKRR